MTHDPNPLAQNDLGKALDRGLNSVDKYSNQIVGGAIALAVIVVAGVLWYRSNQEQNNIAWQECLSAANSGAFEEIANRYTGLPVADWAHLSAGRDQLAEAIALSSYNRSESDKILKKALDNLEAIANSAIPPFNHPVGGNRAVCPSA